MCYNPTRLADGKYVACRVCKQCQQAQVMEWAGRCIAESKNAVAAHMITLTYGRDKTINAPDHLAAAVLQYRHVQTWLKKIRHKFPLRYFAVGEYGDKKGRAHWHIIAFWKRNVPDVPMDERFDWEPWPHGVSHFKKLTHGAGYAYVCKYLQKGDAKIAESASNQVTFKTSRNPPLGSRYIMELAESYVDQHLAPQDLYYNFGDTKYKFFMKGSFAELFIKLFVLIWNYKKEGVPLPSSDLLYSWLDRWERDDVQSPLKVEMKKELIARDREYKRRPPLPLYQPPGWDALSFEFLEIPFDRLQNTYWVWYKGEPLYFAVNEKGQETWLTKIDFEGKKEKSGR